MAAQTLRRQKTTFHYPVKFQSILVRKPSYIDPDPCNRQSQKQPETFSHIISLIPAEVNLFTRHRTGTFADLQRAEYPFDALRRSRSDR